MRAQGLVTYARGLSKNVCFHDEKKFEMTRDFTFKTLFLNVKFQFYLEKTLMRNEAPGNLRVNLRTLLKRANCKRLYSSLKH